MIKEKLNPSMCGEILSEIISKLFVPRQIKRMHYLRDGAVAVVNFDGRTYTITVVPEKL